MISETSSIRQVSHVAKTVELAEKSQGKVFSLFPGEIHLSMHLFFCLFVILSLDALSLLSVLTTVQQTQCKILPRIFWKKAVKQRGESNEAEALRCTQLGFVLRKSTWVKVITDIPKRRKSLVSDYISEGIRSQAQIHRSPVLFFLFLLELVVDMSINDHREC